MILSGEKTMWIGTALLTYIMHINYEAGIMDQTQEDKGFAMQINPIIISLIRRALL